MTAELLGLIGVGLIVVSLAVMLVLIWRAPLRSDLAAVDAELDELASSAEEPAVVFAPAWRDWMGERIEKPWDDPAEDAHQRRLFA